LSLIGCVYVMAWNPGFSEKDEGDDDRGEEEEVIRFDSDKEENRIENFW
jgi:hypothetical protein